MNSQRSDDHNRRTIGVLSGWAGAGGDKPDRYLTSVIRGIQSAALARSYNLLIGWGIGHGVDPYLELPAWPLVSNQTDFVPVGPWNTDGLIIFSPILNEERAAYIQQIIDGGHPVLFIASGDEGPSIQADNEDGIHQAIAHLVEHGHRRIAFVAGIPADKGDGAHRLAAYRSAVEKFGLDDDPRLVTYGEHDYEIAHAAMKTMLAAGVEFTAVMGSDDRCAIGAMQALNAAGLRVPQDVAVIGFDDQPEALIQSPPLTSVHVPLAEIGQRALGLMADHIEGRSRLKSICVPTWLAQRQSCGCLSSAIVSAADSKSSLIDRPISPLKHADLMEYFVHQMTEVMFTTLPTGIHGANKQRDRHLCASLAKAFATSMENADPSHFQKIFMEFLTEVELADHDIHRWQQAVSVMRREMGHLPLSWDQPQARQLAEDLLHQARAAISESVQRQYFRFAHQQGTVNFLLSELNARLGAVNNKNKAVELLNQYLPMIGIEHSRVALFDSDGEDQTAWSVIVDADSNSTEEGRRFPSRQFPPTGMYPAEQLLNLAILPLVFMNESLGYIALDANNLEAGPAIARQIVSTFQSADMHDQITELSLTDALTGLKNRRFFDFVLKNEVERYQRFRHALTLIMIDVDHFKSYNDAFGHPAGDEALKYLSQCLNDHRRKTDLVARLGGEEFAVILTETDSRGAMEVAEKIRAAVANSTGLKRQITISLGISEIHNVECAPETLVEQADKALYEAKGAGRNRVCVFEGSSKK